MTAQNLTCRACQNGILTIVAKIQRFYQGNKKSRSS